MSDLQTKLVEVITQLQSVVKDNAADAVNLGLATIKINGIEHVIIGIIFLLFSISGAFLAKKVYKWWCEAAEKSKDHYFDGFEYGAGMIGTVAITAILFIIFCCNIFNIWTYVAIFQPKLWLAHQILAKAAS
jgi:hypothetical protein